MITIVGIGEQKEDLTRRGAEEIKNAKCVVVKTFKTKAGAALKNKAALSFDELYVSARDFDELNKNAAEKLKVLEKEHGEIVYCTDGDGISDSLTRLLDGDIKIVKGVSLGAKETATSRVRLSAFDAAALKPYLDTALPLEITELDSKELAGEVKLYLLDFYSYDFKAVFFRNGEKKVIPLEDLDRCDKYGSGCSVFLSGDGSLCKKRYSFSDLMRIMAALTAENGCPWDQAQTHESIRGNLVEEAYEAVNAIDAGDVQGLCEEIGDVLLQAVFHCDIASRTGEFGFNDAVDNLCRKLYFRHTHIFGQDKAASAGEALKFWEQAKSVEKDYQGLHDILSRLPQEFPALLRCEKAVKKAVKAGVLAPALKIDEQSAKEKLFALCAACAASDLNAEILLNEKIQEFIAEFQERGEENS